MPHEIARFLEMMAAERGAASNTIAAYRRDLEHVAAHLHRRDGGLAQASSDDLRTYLASVADLYAPRTQARRLAALRQFFAFLVGDGLRPDDPSAALDAPRMGRDLPKTLDLAAIEAMIAAAARLGGARGAQAVALLELGYGAGLRVSEVCALPESVGRGAPVILVRGKGGKERIAPLGGRAQAAVAAWRPWREQALAGRASGHLFPGRDPRRPLTRQSAFHQVKRAARDAGVGPHPGPPPVPRPPLPTPLV